MANYHDFNHIHAQTFFSFEKIQPKPGEKMHRTSEDIC